MVDLDGGVLTQVNNRNEISRASNQKPRPANGFVVPGAQRKTSFTTGADMNQRRRLTKQEREEAAAESGKLRPDRGHLAQEWTDPDGKPVIVTIIER